MTEWKRRSLWQMSIASAGLAVVCFVLLVRTWWASDTITHVTPNGAFQVQAHRSGLFIVILDAERTGDIPVAVGTEWTSDRPTVAWVWPERNLEGWEDQMILGFGLTGGDDYTAARIPLWYLVAMFAVLPIWWLRHPLRDLRAKFGTCAACGYDLRTSADRCPECGTPFKSAKIVPPPPPARKNPHPNPLLADRERE